MKGEPRMVRFQPPQDWQQWVEWLAAGLHGRNRWRLSVVLLGMIFARGRRTVTTWLRAVGIQHDFADYYYFLHALGRKAKELAERAQDIAKIPRKHGWRFRTKLVLAAQAVLRFARLVKLAGKTVWAVADGAYSKRAFPIPLRGGGGDVVR